MRMISTPTSFFWVISVVQLKRVGRYDFLSEFEDVISTRVYDELIL